MSAEGYPVWCAEAWVEGFEDAIRGLAKAGCIKRDVKVRIDGFFDDMGLSQVARKSVLEILERELPR